MAQEPNIKGDPGTQASDHNLITNAIKYNDKSKGIINILAERDQQFPLFLFLR